MLRHRCHFAGPRIPALQKVWLTSIRVSSAPRETLYPCSFLNHDFSKLCRMLKIVSMVLRKPIVWIIPRGYTLNRSVVLPLAEMYFNQNVCACMIASACDERLSRRGTHVLRICVSDLFFLQTTGFVLEAFSRLQFNLFLDKDYGWVY